MNERIEGDLWNQGYALAPAVLGPDQIGELKQRYNESSVYRSTIVMARHNFGSGEYRYYAYPLPEAIAALRHSWYEALVPIANAWNEATRVKERYPATLDAYLHACNALDSAVRCG